MCTHQVQLVYLLAGFSDGTCATDAGLSVTHTACTHETHVRANTCKRVYVCEMIYETPGVLRSLCVYTSVFF
jgi:hypothetical protein